VLIHGALIADAFRPLLAEPALRDQYRVIHYHRRGYGGAHTAAAVDLARQAADCRALLHHLGVRRVHVVGHSLGGTIALRLALDAPDLVHALALLEPDEHGMTHSAEYEHLQAIEEELAGALESQGALEVGRVTGRGLRTFHYYGPESSDVAGTVDAVMQLHAEYRYRSMTADDPAWKIYSEYLYPDDDQLAFANDMKIVQGIIGAGADLSEPRSIVHTIRFDDRDKAAIFCDALANQGYRVNRDSENTFTCETISLFHPFRLTDMRPALTSLSDEFACHYAGCTV